MKPKRETKIENRRVCASCGASYSIEEYRESSSHYFGWPYYYSDGCETDCLACWLGVGPGQELPMGGEGPLGDREGVLADAGDL